mgnify:CR=1 FL=1
MSGRTGCLICGAPLHYFQQERELECALCHRKFPANASCEAGHFVCDECHARRGLEVIREACGKSASRDPITLMQEIMENPFLYMHGPEHHVLVGAALLPSDYDVTTVTWVEQKYWHGQPCHVEAGA